MYHYLVEHYGDIASVAGLLVTFVGFAATIPKVREAKRAAEDARRAAREALLRVGSQLLANEIGTSLQLIREIDSACRERNWSTAIHRCDEARARLAQLQDDPGLVPDERAMIRSATDDFRSIIPKLDKIKAGRLPKDLPPKTFETLHDLIIGLSRTKGRLQARTLEV